MITARIIADSLAPSGVRLTTFLVTYPRLIHSEFMTHRAFSRNASSSRAIPFKKQMAAIKQHMAEPLSFMANKPGMQGGNELPAWKQWLARKVWRLAGHTAVLLASLLDKLNVHKQLTNRIVEPFAHITVVLTGTDAAFANFFALRHHEMAQPEIAELAKRMWAHYEMSNPQHLPPNGWHLPFIRESEYKSWTIDNLIKFSVARCARTSYLTHEGVAPNPEKDLQLHDRLLADRPMHASPAEHQGLACDYVEPSGNFHGWIQYRHTLEGESCKTIEEFKKRKGFV